MGAGLSLPGGKLAEGRADLEVGWGNFESPESGDLLRDCCSWHEPLCPTDTTEQSRPRSGQPTPECHMHSITVSVPFFRACCSLQGAVPLKT